ncbi:uncharacterized protein LOC143081583 isoform X2 [Mytilus galloprovincialis]|uniref:uncharacterized protein LOC143081583 isoform X2 n=1 Tax=Mytilus galloprovincialis TaxID=29158 RepID=UPI003F7C627C
MTSFLFIIKVPVEEAKHKSKETEKQDKKEIQTDDQKKDEVQTNDLKKDVVQNGDLKRDDAETDDLKKDGEPIEKEETEDKEKEISDKKENKITTDNDETKDSNKTPDDKNETDKIEKGVVQQSSATTLDEWDFGEDDHVKDTETAEEVPFKKEENKPIDTDEDPNKKEENNPIETDEVLNEKEEKKLVDLDTQSPFLFEQAKGLYHVLKDMVIPKNDVASSEEGSNVDADEKSRLLAESSETSEKVVVDRKDSEPKNFEVEAVDEKKEIIPLLDESEKENLIPLLEESKKSEIKPLLEESEKSEEPKESPKKSFDVTAVEAPKPETESKGKEPIPTADFYKSTDKKNAISLPEIKSLPLLGLTESKSSASLQGENSIASLPNKGSSISLGNIENLHKKVQFLSQVSAPNEEDLHPFIEPTTILEDTEAILDDFGIENYVVSKTATGKFYQILFIDEGGEKCEMILNKLVDQGIGKMDNTSVGIYPSSIFKGAATVADNSDESDRDSEGSIYEGEFRKSIKARLLVSQVVSSVQSNAEFKFDYLMLIITASIIAGLGLIENSSVILVASMLVSPLMGPILAGTFGFVIKNYSLRNLGIASEFKGLLICVLCGFIVGLIASSIAVNYGTLGGTESWPTDEMKVRGVLRGLVPGLMIALASGIGVALSVLGGNAGSLVGVAISASLLPPAVNAGMLWAHSLVTVIKPLELAPQIFIENQNASMNTTVNITVNTAVSLICPAYLNNKYEPVHSCQMEIESIILGCISLSLTILNIFCIFIVGIIFLKIKEVAPQTSVSDEARGFWKDDIKIARDSYVTLKGKQSLSFGAEAKKLLEELRKKQGEGNVERLRNIIEAVEQDSSVQYVQSRIPGSNRSNALSRQLPPEFFAESDSVFSPTFPKHYTYTYHGPSNRSSMGFFRPQRVGSDNTHATVTSAPIAVNTDESSPLIDGSTESSSKRSPGTSFLDKLKSPTSLLFQRRKGSNSDELHKMDPV